MANKTMLGSLKQEIKSHLNFRMTFYKKFQQTDWNEKSALYEKQAKRLVPNLNM